MNEIKKYDVDYLSSIEDVLDDAKKGKMFILVDDEDRENEGDLIIPAEKVESDPNSKTSSKKRETHFLRGNFIKILMRRILKI